MTYPASGQPINKLRVGSNQADIYIDYFMIIVYGEILLASLSCELCYVHLLYIFFSLSLSLKHDIYSEHNI